MFLRHLIDFKGLYEKVSTLASEKDKKNMFIYTNLFIKIKYILAPFCSTVCIPRQTLKLNAFLPAKSIDGLYH